MSEQLLSGGGTTVGLVVGDDLLSVLEVRLEPGAGAGPHVHTREDETIVVLEGRLDVDPGEPRTLGAGEAIVLRRGVRHSFANARDEPVRAHFICTPGGLERFFRDVAAATSDSDVVAAAERAGVVFG